MKQAQTFHPASDEPTASDLRDLQLEREADERAIFAARERRAPRRPEEDDDPF